MSVLLEIAPDPRERAMQSDLDRVRLQSENFPNLTRAEIGAVAQGQEIPGALVEAVSPRRARPSWPCATAPISARVRLGKFSD